MNEPIMSAPPSAEDLFYIKWGEESLKKSIENAHGVLTQFLTMNTGLMGGSIVFLKPENIDKLLMSIVFYWVVYCFSWNTSA
jgi:hypothetical protein